MKPYLLVDVDGVLFPFVAQHGDELRPCGGVEWIGHNPAMVERLRTLDTEFECMWATARYDDVLHTVAPFFGIGFEWRVLPFGKVERRGQQIIIEGFRKGWKLPYVKDWIERQPMMTPVAYVDDDIDELSVQFAANRNLTTPTLFLRIPPEVGLTDAHVETLLAWKRSLTSAILAAPTKE